MEQDPDRDLVRDLGGDDPARRRAALAGIYERYHRRVFAVVERVIGDWAVAQEVTQEVFLHLAERIRTFRGDSAFSSWVYRVAVNRAIDARRWEARRPAWTVGGDPDDREDISSRGRAEPPQPGAVHDREVAARRVAEALRLLSPKLRAILVLRYLEGLSYETLAEVLACSIGTVKSRLNRAHEAMVRVMRARPPRPGDDQTPTAG